ncbi:thiol-disulfide oxidoreductase DCC family protein [Bryobacter aggregatus]|uniref:thiol-disulfide oxidoreductase DCC family protein n=1 Tax=Bryobacter aggregatus TaxID=360054 RepID=UPI0009B59A68|nr:DCC1-like thiol-disulfide oxidoreductase family protein [Bryobacter aggregatus]
MSRLFVLFDGYCNLCDSFVSFVMRQDRRKRFEFVPLQSEEGLRLLSEAGFAPQSVDSVVLIENGIGLRKSDAALRIFWHLGWPWRSLSWLRLFPLALRDSVYTAIAKSRYRVFGKKEFCELSPRSRMQQAARRIQVKKDD